MAPVVDGMVTQFGGQVALRRVNSDQEPDIFQRFGVRLVPTYVVLDPSGRQVDMVPGAYMDRLQTALQKAAGKS
jgi:thioredoxin-like negative regulator of GroEL